MQISGDTTSIIQKYIYFGIDSTEFLKEFVKSPVDKIPEQIRQQYDINTWIDQYLP